MKKNRKIHPCLLAICINLALCSSAYASTVRSDIAYQLYRDFAENKGLFQPGATDITIYDNAGILVGTLNKAPMPDFSSVDSTIGVSTLIDSQHVVSVKHNGGYNAISFGGTGKNPDYHRASYLLVNRNNHSTRDFHVPRLNKLVTEVAPAVMTDAFNYGAYYDSTRFPVFYRLGSGTQRIKDPDGKQYWKGGAYKYLTGGTVGKPTISDWSFVSSTADIYNPLNGPMGTYGEAGDSGSPLFAWDTQRSIWVLVGVLNSGIPQGNRWVILIPDFIKQIQEKDNTEPDVNLTVKNSILRWTFDESSGIGALVSDYNGQSWVMHGLEGNNADAGKNLTFSGEGGTLLLQNNTDQGAGALTFRSDYLVSSDNNSSWKGAGLTVTDGVTVRWQVKGVSGDRLHKLGTGTLIVQGTGVNPGGLNVGDGTVVLDQQADTSGNKQAFSSVNIVSGRPTVVLSDSSQINPNNIYFGYRGGRLDLNGNDIVFSRIKAVDSGAMLVNHNMQKPANIFLVGRGINKTANQLFPGFLGEYDNARNNGELNIHYIPPVNSDFLVLIGGGNVNGTLNATGGNILLSGAPLLHAGNIYGGEWTPSAFSFRTIEVEKGNVLQMGIYAAVTAGILAGEGSHIVVGYNNDNLPEENTLTCSLNDDTGLTDCNRPFFSDSEREKIPLSLLNGDISLAKNASLVLGKALYTGAVNGEESSTVRMARDSHWIMTSDSTVGSMSMKKGALVSLSSTKNSKGGNILKIRGNLEGEGHFELNTRLAEQQGDRIVIGGLASGNYTLTVRDNGSVPLQDGRMQPLMTLSNPAQDFSQVDVVLAGGHVDIGTWRYRLIRHQGDYLLYNPEIPLQSLEPAMLDNNQAEWLSHESNTAVSYFTSHFNQLTRQGDNTERHLEGLKPSDSGLWLSYDATELRYGNSSYRGYRQKMINQSIGMDWHTDIPRGELQWGGVFSSTLSQGKFDEGARSNDNMRGVNLYGKLSLNNGFLLSGYSGLHHIGYTLNDRNKTERSKRFGYIANVSAGYKWQVGWGMQVEPEAGITLYGLPSGQYRLNDKMKISEESLLTIQHQAGIKVRRDADVSGVMISPFAKITHRVNSDADKNVKVNGNQLDAELPRQQTELSLGGSISPSDTFQLNVTGKYITGGSLKDSKNLGLELKYLF